MKLIAPRLLTVQEIDVIRNAVAKASIGLIPDRILDDITNLSVVGECECGCRSVYFCNPSVKDYRIADGVGYLPGNERVDILVWANSGGLAALELVDHASSGMLPLPDSICSWEEAGIREAKK